MPLFQIITCAILVVGVTFLFSGLYLAVFVKTRSSRSKPVTIVLSIPGKFEVSLPDKTSYVLLAIGVVLLGITCNLYNGGPAAQDSSASSKIISLDLISPAYAQESNKLTLGSRGWVYFGDEKEPEQWNFRILKGSYSDLKENKQNLLLKSTISINVRQKPYGDFTGTVLETLDPPGSVVGILPSGSCITPLQNESVGFNKIWLNVEVVDCPA